MPPPGAPQPPKEEVAFIRQWIEHQIDAKPTRRVTAHRLNRAEYNNTIRDLLGLTLRPAGDFPLDDAGYGFDNIGDVLSVSPLLMEKYLTAARQISHTAVYGARPPAAPAKLIRLMTKKSQDDSTPGTLPFANRGALYGSFYFPVTGTYELRMRVGNYRPRLYRTPRHRELFVKKQATAAEQAELLEFSRQDYAPVRMLLTVDGKTVLAEKVEGNIDYAYAHGESIGHVRLTAGEHHFRASFPELAALADPLENMNTDGRRKLFIDYLDIVGPFEPAPFVRQQIFVCTERTKACADRIIETLARRAYRRPVTSADLAPLHRLAAMVRDSGDSFEESIRVALQAILVSPHFLFRFETAEPHSLAARLSYFLWSSMPDEALLKAAQQLHQPRVLEAQVRRMLMDPKADALIENFAGQWLGLRQLDKRKPDPKTFPLADDELLDDMRQETILFTRAILREDRSVLDFLGGRFSYVNGPLARHYGIPNIQGEAFQRVDLTGTKRGGILTHGSVLTQSSYATRTSPVLRGRWVLENILGSAPPPPPADIPALKEEQLGTAASLRERLEQHRAKASCAVCHNQMDAIGFTLENYDATGAWRDREGRFPIDATGQLPTGEKIEGAEGLQKMLSARAEAFTTNLAERLLTYATGRGVEPSDRAAVNQIVERTTRGRHRFTELILATVQSQAFLQGDPLAP